MFNMEDLMEAKNQASKNKGNKKDTYNETILKGIELYEEFIETDNDDKIKGAADKFIEALEINRNKMEPYLFLAIIFFTFDEKEKAHDYFEAALEIGSDQEGFDQLTNHVREMIYSSAA